MEIQRVAAIAPMAVPHRAMSDINIRGYKIPKVNILSHAEHVCQCFSQDTMIWCILYHMMRDPDYWTDPDTFNPDRFLGEDGKILKEERFVPYGIGIL